MTLGDGERRAGARKSERSMGVDVGRWIMTSDYLPSHAHGLALLPSPTIFHPSSRQPVVRHRPSSSPPTSHALRASRLFAIVHRHRHRPFTLFAPARRSPSSIVIATDLSRSSRQPVVRHRPTSSPPTFHGLRASPSFANVHRHRHRPLTVFAPARRSPTSIVIVTDLSRSSRQPVVRQPHRR
jgi:hypothetical protein